MDGEVFFPSDSAVGLGVEVAMVGEKWVGFCVDYFVVCGSNSCLAAVVGIFGLRSMRSITSQKTLCIDY